MGRVAGRSGSRSKQGVERTTEGSERPVAASATAPSMQPPDTLPAIRPEAVTAKRDPAGRGELPQVSTTVASATFSPSAAHAAAVVRTSSSLMPRVPSRTCCR